MNIATTATQVAEVDNSVDLLEGWDTVFAIRYADVNSAIVKAESSPPGFDATITDDLLQMLMPKGDWGESATAVGTFGDWALAPGGAGHKIQMTLPVPTVTLTRPGHPDVTRTDVTFSIEVELAPISRGKNSGADGGELFDFKLLAPQGAGDYTITVTDCSYQGSDQDQINRAFLIAIMTVWLNDNTAQFDHTFATVNLNAKAAHDKFDWLMPTTTSYAVNDQGTMESGIFGVLCMTENRAPSKNQQIMTEALPPEQRS
ncbi:MAG: TULIP family P47-like protein, partial [Alphaproteobacteria bacterium]|nr:TULIP family P47-like protein [Alphaproteobacteria bacterium]